MPTNEKGETPEPVAPEVPAVEEEIPQVEPKTEMEEEFDKERAMATITKLRAIEKKAKVDAKKIEAFEQAEEKRKQAEMSETERLQAELEKRRAQLKNAQLLELKRQAATKHSLPEALVSRLQGETLEEIEADAQALAETLPKPVKAANIQPTNPGAPSSGESEEERRRRLLG